MSKISKVLSAKIAQELDLQKLDLNGLFEKALCPGPRQEDAKSELQNILQLDEANFTYYLSLFQKRKSRRQTQSLKLAPETDSVLVAYPVGTPDTPPEIERQFKSICFSRIQEEFEGRFAKSVVLVLRKLHAGTGSSMSRQKYFSARPEMSMQWGTEVGQEVKVGAKGTDLLAKISDPLRPEVKVEVPIAELQLLQFLRMASQGHYARLVVQDVVGPETQAKFAQIWEKKSLLNPSLSYAEVFKSTEGIDRAPSFFQSHVPALDGRGRISMNRMAPAGHGLFAVDALRAALKPESIPGNAKDKTVMAIANGEDLNSLPDPAIVDWMVKNEIPIVLVTTTKTPVDVKGGLLTIVKNQKTNETYLKVLDTAEANAAGQTQVFEKSAGIASTNLTFFNYEVLCRKLSVLSDEELISAAAPDLVPNWKEQKDSDGATRKYLQLEGTMGSAILNLDRHYRKKFSEPLVSIVNIEVPDRTRFFSPIKSAFDYFLQFHSDRFSIDESTYRIEHLGGAELPRATLKDPMSGDAFYQDVQNVLETFANTSVLKLREIEISGQVLLRDLILEGHVRIINQCGKKMNLKEFLVDQPRSGDGRAVLKDAEVGWTEKGSFYFRHFLF